MNPGPGASGGPETAQAAGPAPEVRVEYRTIHGYRRAYRIAGSGPALLLLHGIGDDSSAWSDVIGPLARHHTVIAPDLLGHGLSDKPRADYSIAAFANGVRDLLVVLGITRVTVIGHSLGGGVATQFCYQFPRFAERLVLVASGGVARDVNPVLRLVSTPLALELLAGLRLPGVLPAMRSAARVVASAPDLSRFPTFLSPHHALADHEDLLRVLSNLTDPTASAAFVRTLRAVVDWRGQVVTMLDRCHLTGRLPVLVMWGNRDTVIPYSHAFLVHSAIPGSELVTFAGAGHFPFRYDPARFVNVIEDFVARHDPVDFDPVSWRALMSEQSDDQAAAPNSETLAAVRDAIADDRSPS